MKGSGFVFDYVHFFYYKYDNISLNRGGSYKDSPDWTKNRKATIYPNNKKDNKCFQYAVIVALNYEEIKKDLQRITKIKPFRDKYNSEGISFSSEKDNGKNIRKIIQKLLLMFCMLKKKKYILLMFKKIIQVIKNKLLF